jgi:hypothetical protein
LPAPLQGSWSIQQEDLSAETQPPLANVPAATFSAPFRASIPACSPATKFPTASQRYFQFKVRAVLPPGWLLDWLIHTPGSAARFHTNLFVQAGSACQHPRQLLALLYAHKLFLLPQQPKA